MFRKLVEKMFRRSPKKRKPIEAFIQFMDGYWRITYRDWGKPSGIRICQQLFNSKEEAERYLGPAYMPKTPFMTYNSIGTYSVYPYIDYGLDVRSPCGACNAHKIATAYITDSDGVVTELFSNTKYSSTV